jgi:hypothetical protein
MVRIHRESTQQMLNEFLAQMLPLELELRQYDLSDVPGMEEHLRDD